NMIRYSACVVSTPPAMKLIVVLKLGSSRFDRPKIPWPLVHTPPRSAPDAMNIPPTNIQAAFPACPHPMAWSNMPSDHVGSHPPLEMAERNPPSTRPRTNGSRHFRFDRSSLRRKYGCSNRRLQTSSNPEEMPRRRFPTNSRHHVTAAIPAPATAQWSGGALFRMRGVIGNGQTLEYAEEVAASRWRSSCT